MLRGCVFFLGEIGRRRSHAKWWGDRWLDERDAQNLVRNQSGATVLSPLYKCRPVAFVVSIFVKISLAVLLLHIPTVQNGWSCF